MKKDAMTNIARIRSDHAERVSSRTDDWITINGTHVSTDKDGDLQGAVGEKISATTKEGGSKAKEGKTSEKKPRAPRRKKNGWEKLTGGTWQPLTKEQYNSLETGRMLADTDGGHARVVVTRDGPYIELGRYHMMKLKESDMKDFMWTDWVKPESPFRDEPRRRW